MSTRHFSIPVRDGSLPGSAARRDGAGASVVIMPSGFGITPDLEMQMDELASTARIVVAIDPFFRMGGGLIPYDDTARVVARVQHLDRERAYEDLRAAIDWVRASEGGRPVLMLGICIGGGFALKAAADGVVAGVATWHGTRMERLLERSGDMRCPMRLHFGGADPVVPPDSVEAVRSAFAGRSDVQVIVHDGATHGFSHRGAPRAYDARAERAAMDSVRELISCASAPA